MSTFKDSKDDVLNPTQDFKNGFVKLSGYTTTEITALDPAAIDYYLVLDTTLGKLKYWNGTAFETITTS